MYPRPYTDNQTGHTVSCLISLPKSQDVRQVSGPLEESWFIYFTRLIKTTWQSGTAEASIILTADLRLGAPLLL